MSGLLCPVIVNWNLAEDTIACVRSLLAAGVSPSTMIVVDNGSNDNSPAQLEHELGENIELICSKQNLGFAGGYNLGIQQALAQGAEWVLLLNNDTLVAPNFFEEMQTAIQEYPDYPIIAPLIFYHAEPQRIWSLGDRVLLDTLITRSLWRDQEVKPDLPPFVPVDFLNGCCLLVHRKVFAQIGFLDTTFFMYAEDVDFCWRARRAGFKLGCWTRAHIWHKVARSTGVNHPQRRYWRISNQIRFYRRYAQGWQKLLLILFTFLRSGKLAIIDLGHGRMSLAHTTMQAWYTGWYDLIPYSNQVDSLSP